jgi:hypothetical protein
MHVIDAVRAAQEQQRLCDKAGCMSAMDRRGLEALLLQIKVQALIIENELLKAQNGENE